MTPRRRTAKRPSKAIVAPEAMPKGQLNKLVSEARFQSDLIKVLDDLGWWWWHDQDSRRNKAGLPDLILIRPPRLVFVELKRQQGRRRKAQITVLALLARCPGVEVYLWRPAEWNAIKANLASRERPAA